MRTFDLAIVGSGPGGYVAAIRAAQLGMGVALIEAEELGGVCLNWGCIPTKTILSAAEHLDALKRGKVPGVRAEGLTVDYGAVIDASRQAAGRLQRGVGGLLRKNQVQILTGRARLSGPRKLVISGATDSEEIEARHILLATGSTELILPGVEVDGRRVLTSREVLASRELPASVVIIGGGAVGVEFAYAYSVYGAAVTIVEMQDQLLPGGDPDVAQALASSFTRRHIKLATGTSFQGVEIGTDGVTVSVQGEKGEAQLAADQMLLAVGRRPCSEDLGLEEVGVELERGFVKVGPDYQSSVAGIWAIGDLIGGPLLAHKASEEGRAAVEFMLGQRKRPVNRALIPACVYCEPQVACVGLTEEQARQAGHEVRVGRMPFAASGKAVGSGATEGFVKLVADARYGEILGCHAIGAGVTELIAEVALAMALEATVSDVGEVCHAHPTLSEVVMEAALAVEGRAIHF